jgi:hypothetical protein
MPGTTRLRCQEIAVLPRLSNALQTKSRGLASLREVLAVRAGQALGVRLARPRTLQRDRNRHIQIAQRHAQNVIRDHQKIALTRGRGGLNSLPAAMQRSSTGFVVIAIGAKSSSPVGVDVHYLRN